MQTHKMETKLSLSSLDKLIKHLEIKKKNYPQIALRIADRLADEMMLDIYPDTEKISAKLEGKKAIAGIKNEQEKWTYKEYGTGIVGSMNPHVAEALESIGWKYDVNEHGERGWWYPKEDGTFGWTKGQKADMKFYNALKKAEELFPEIGQEELLREVGK